MCSGDVTQDAGGVFRSCGVLRHHGTVFTGLFIVSMADWNVSCLAECFLLPFRPGIFGQFHRNVNLWPKFYIWWYFVVCSMTVELRSCILWKYMVPWLNVHFKLKMGGKTHFLLKILILPYLTKLYQIFNNLLIFSNIALNLISLKDQIFLLPTNFTNLNIFCIFAQNLAF